MLRKVLPLLVVAAALASLTAEAQTIAPANVARTFTSTAPSGVGGIIMRNTGTICMDSTCTTQIRSPSAGNLQLTGTSMTLGAAGGITFSNGVLVNGSTLSGSVSTALLINIWQPGGTALETCGATLEGRIRRLTGTGGTGTGTRSRLCLCTSDGAASPVYAWQNVVTGTVATATTCNP